MGFDGAEPVRTDRRKLAADSATHLKIEQLREVLRLHLFRIIGNLAVSVFVALEFVNGPLRGRMIVWAALMGAIILADVVLYRRVRRTGIDRTNVAFLHSRSIVANALFGGAWGLALVLLYPEADAARQFELTVVVTAMLCTAPFVLASMPVGVFAFSAPLLAGAIAGLAMDGIGRHAFEFGLLTVYALVFPFGLRQHARVFRERVSALLRLNEKNQLIRLFLHDFEANSTDWLWRTDNQHRIIMLSPTFEARAGVDPRAIADLPLREFTARYVTSDESRADAILAPFESEKPFRDALVRLTINGEIRWWELSGTPNRSRTGAFLGFHGIGRDVTARVEAERKLRFLAHHDALTGGHNRAAFRAALDHAVLAATAEGEAAAVLLLDLDRFKHVNDTAGHAVGDEVLKEAFRRFRNAMPRNSLVARVGGDEFAAIVPLRSGPAEAARAAERAIATISTPIRLQSGVFSIGASAGMATMPDMGSTPVEILRLADAALYMAKESGKGCVRIADGAQIDAITLRSRLEADLQRVIADGGLHLEYQPVVDAATGSTAALEAFVRWRHPELGAIAPREFLALAEQSGAFQQLGRFTIEVACAQAAALPGSVAVAVNLSPRQFADGDMPGFIAECLARHGVDAGRLEFEITEGAYLGGLAAVKELSAAYTAIGVKLVLDDFGAGSSSFTSFCEVPFAKMKIDRALVSRASSDPRARVVIESIIAIGRSLNVPVTAEGVETGDQAEFLRGIGCTLMQGYHFAMPMRAEELPAYLLGEMSRKSADGKNIEAA